MLGIPIDYYAMVDLEGFARFINAIGGVTVTVTERLPIGGLIADGTRVRRVGYIEPGTQKLAARRRCGTPGPGADSTDYDRMIRQRCLIGAMVRQAEPLTVLKHFQELASATKRLAQTDIPRSVLPDMITLGERMHGGGSIRSIAFVPPVISTGDPNYARIRTLAGPRWRRRRRSRARRRRPPPRSRSRRHRDDAAAQPDAAGRLHRGGRGSELRDRLVPTGRHALDPPGETCWRPAYGICAPRDLHTATAVAVGTRPATRATGSRQTTTGQTAWAAT